MVHSSRPYIHLHGEVAADSQCGVDGISTMITFESKRLGPRAMGLIKWDTGQIKLCLVISGSLGLAACLVCPVQWVNFKYLFR